MNLRISITCLILAASTSQASNCSTLTREKLINNSAGCAGFNSDPECMKGINWTNIGKQCLDKLDGKAFAAINTKIAEEIMSTSSIADIPAKPALMLALFKATPDWSKCSAAEHFLKAAAISTEHTEAIMTGTATDLTLQGAFFSEKNAAVHKNACAKITKQLVSNISPKFFQAMSPQCFTLMSEEAFAGLDQERFAAIKPSNLQLITVAQAKKIPDLAFVGMTAEQAKNWGAPYNVPEDKDAAAKYKEAHPCVEGIRIAPFLKPAVKRTFIVQCKLKNSSAPGSAKPDLTKAILASSIFLFFMFAI